MSPGPIITVTVGDPGGVGPEVVVRSLCDPSIAALARWLVVGSRRALDHAAHSCALGLSWAAIADTDPGPVAALGACRVIDIPGSTTDQGHWRHAPDRANGRASLDALRIAIEIVKATPEGLARCPHAADAVVTGPICKESWVLAGETRYPGHTELFAESFASPDAAMMFAAEPAPGDATRPGLYVILATAHVPLDRVAPSLSAGGVLRVITQGARTMQHLGFGSPRIGVCGINPHAGEHGVLGTQDDAVIAPAVHEARRQGLDVSGPHPGDTIFPGALHRAHAPASRFDLVVAMYHDQGLIPVKLLAFDRAVNLTAGLDWQGRTIVRTSPDHGTAFDIAGRGCADPGSMKAALRLAVTLAERSSRDR